MRSVARTAAVGVAFVFFFAIFLIMPVWTQQDQRVPLRIAVVNIREVFSKYKAAIEFENSVETEKTKMQGEIDKIESEMKRIVDEIKQLDKESPVWRQRSLQLVQFDTERKFINDEWQAKITRRLNRNTAAMYNKIRDEIDAYAAAQGFDLVLKVESTKLEMESSESANTRINRRNVLCWKEGLDVTKVIVERMNKQ